MRSRRAAGQGLGFLADDAAERAVYVISVAAELAGMHPQTLRQYEREGLLEPSRTEGKMRLYSEKDMDRIKMILRLTRDLGVNLAGVDIILQLKEQIEQSEVMIRQMKEELAKMEQGGVPSKKALVKRKNSFDLIFYDDKN
mgnify:CR=1 FL=1